MDLSNQRRFNIYWGSFNDGKGGHISPFIRVMETVPTFSFLVVFFLNVIVTKVAVDWSVLRKNIPYVEFYLG